MTGGRNDSTNNQLLSFIIHFIMYKILKYLAL